MKDLKFIAIACGIAARLWFGLIESAPGVDNLALFVAWAFGACMWLACLANHKQEDHGSILTRSFMFVWRVFCIGVIVWSGHFVLAGVITVAWLILKAKQQGAEKGVQ